MAKTQMQVMKNRKKLYRVLWEIEVEASSTRNAARLARSIQLDPSHEATIFQVRHGRGSLLRVHLRSAA